MNCNRIKTRYNIYIIKTEYRRLKEVYYKRYQRISISKQDEKF